MKKSNNKKSKNKKQTKAKAKKTHMCNKPHVQDCNIRS